MEELFETIVRVLTDYFEVKPLFDEDETSDWRTWGMYEHGQILQVFWHHQGGPIEVKIVHLKGTIEKEFENNIVSVLQEKLKSAQWPKVRITSRVPEHLVA